MAFMSSPLNLFVSFFHILYQAKYHLSILFAVYLIYRLIDRVVLTYRIRTRYKDIPSLPRHPIWGNLVNMGPRLNPSLNRHPDYAFEEFWNELGQPPCFLMDLAPIDQPFLIIAEPQIAEQVVQATSQYKHSLPKSDTIRFLRPLVGLESILVSEGEDWKTLRRRFNPGFQPKYLCSLAPSIAAKTKIFVDRLKAAAKTGETFRLETYAKDLTTDIITELTIERDLLSQSLEEGQGEKSMFGVLTASRRLSSLIYPVGRGFAPLAYIDPIRPAKAWFYEHLLDRKLGAMITRLLRTHQNSSSPSSSNQKSKSIVQLATTGLPVTKSLITNTVHQIKTFLFAGQDTTSTLIQWMAYELSKASYSPEHAAILSKLRAEHDAIYGSSSSSSSGINEAVESSNNPFAALDILSDPDSADAILGSKLPYTTAFIKETLRLHPPASTARMASSSPPLFLPMSLSSTPSSSSSSSSSNTTTTTTTTTHPSSDAAAASPQTAIDGLRIYASQWLIHRNPHVWGSDAHVFRPCRWLDEEYVSRLPSGAYRPFERGPRNCIGQDLAMLEAKVVLSAVARGLDWEKVGLDGGGGRRQKQQDQKKKQTKIKEEGEKEDGEEEDETREVWNIHQVTSVPVDGMMMKVRLV